MNNKNELENHILNVFPTLTDRTLVKGFIIPSDINCTNLKGIGLLPNLSFLDCSNSKLHSLDGIEELKQLKTLFCVNNYLTTLKPIIKLNIEVLECYQNNFIYPFKLSSELSLNNVKNYHLKEKIVNYLNVI